MIRVQNKANLDLWWCESNVTRRYHLCGENLQHLQECFCVSCAEGSSCNGCGEFICSECEFDDRLVSCFGCGDTFCEECIISDKIGICREVVATMKA